MSARTRRIVVVGAGVAGAIVTRGLSALGDVDVICLERAAAGAQSGAGTGLNVGPNALKTLNAHLPDLAATVIAASIPWRRWTIDLTDGTRLFDVDLADVADNPGIRIRWAELYRILREGLDPVIRYGAQVTRIARDADGRATVSWTSADGPATLTGVDLVIAADGRYSRVREQLVGPPDPSFLGVSMYRVLLPAAPDCPIDDYGQWFNGPNRLLAFRLPGGQVYCAGTFPIDTIDGAIPDAMKQPDVLRRLYTPATGRPSPEAAFLIDGLTARVPEIHWARVQEDRIELAVPGWPVLLLGDAAHPMIPTLGQGATQSVEDACVAIDAAADALGRGEPLGDVPATVDARRRGRVGFVMDFSREASDTILAKADPVSGTLAKTRPPFIAQLRRLYRDVPLPQRRDPAEREARDPSRAAPGPTPSAALGA